MVGCFFCRKEVEMNKLLLLIPAIASVSQGIATERFTVNAGDLVNNNYKSLIKKVKRTNHILCNLNTMDNGKER